MGLGTFWTATLVIFVAVISSVITYQTVNPSVTSPLSTESYKGGRYPTKTTFKEIDEEHSEIAHALQHLLDLCTKHWETEQRLYEEGKMKCPSNHPHDIHSLWKEHDSKHREFISRLKKFQRDLDHHIKEYDVPHFHFGPD